MTLEWDLIDNQVLLELQFGTIQGLLEGTTEMTFESNINGI